MYRQLGLLQKAWQPGAKATVSLPQEDLASPSVPHRCAPGSCSCSTQSGCSCSSCWSERNSISSSHGSHAVLSLAPFQPHAIAMSAQPLARRSSSSSSKTDSMAMATSAALQISAGSSRGVADDLDTECNSSVTSFAEGASIFKEDVRDVPAAASSLLSFPRILRGYLYPPQPSAVPMAFFGLHATPKGSTSRSNSSSSSSSNAAAAAPPPPLVVPTSRIQLLQCMIADTAAVRAFVRICGVFIDIYFTFLIVHCFLINSMMGFVLLNLLLSAPAVLCVAQVQATIQRCIRGYFTRLRYQAALVWRHLLQQQQQREHRAAIRIQSAWRRLKAVEELLQRKTARDLAIERERAAIKIQALWRMHAQQFPFQTERLVSKNYFLYSKIPESCIFNIFICACP